MASGANIPIVVTDSVGPTIEPKLRGIAAGARDADASLVLLQQTLGKLASSGNAGLAATLRSISAATTQLKNTTTNYGTAAANAATQNNKLAQSYDTVNTALRSLTVTLKNYSTQLQAANGGNVKFSNGQRQAGAAAHGTVSEVAAASAAIRGLEGNFGTSVRAGERFLVTTLKLGPILQAAFPVFGALAMIGILDQLVEHINHVAEAFKAMTLEATEASRLAIIEGNKIIKAQRESGFSASNVARVLAGAAPPPETITIPNLQAQKEQLDRQAEIDKAVAKANEEGLKGGALERQKIKDLEAEIANSQKRLALAQQIRDTVNEELKAHQTITKTTPNTTSSNALASRGTFGQLSTGEKNFTYDLPKITDPKQRKALEDALKEAVNEAGNTLSSGAGTLDNKPTLIGQLEVDIRRLQEQERGAKLALPLKEIGDESKLARAEMQKFRKEYADLLSESAKTGQPVTPQAKFELFSREARNTRFDQNRTELETKAGEQAQAITRQDEQLKAIVNQYKEGANAIGLYSNEQRIHADLTKVETTLGVKLYEVNKSVRDELEAYIRTAVEGRNYQQALNQVYEEAHGPIDKLNASIAAANTEFANGDLNVQQFVRSLKLAHAAYDDATDPLKKINDSLREQEELVGFVGTQEKIEAEIQKYRNDLLKQGRDLNQADADALRKRVATLIENQRVQRELNSIYETTVGKLEELASKYKAIQEAQAKGFISHEQAKSQEFGVQVEAAQTRLGGGETLGASGKDILTSTIGSYAKDFTTIADSIQKTFSKAFGTIADGAADAFGRAIVYGDNLGEALRNVARQGIQEIISGLIKMAIQWAIVNGLSKLFKIPKTQDAKDISKNTAASVASIATITGVELASIHAMLPAAWSLAEALSLTSFGANAAAATAGISAVIAAGQAAQHFALGGLVPGSGNTDSVSAMLTPGEFVLSKAAVQKLGVTTLQALNKGTTTPQGVRTVGNSSTSNQMNVRVIHDGSTHIEANALGHDEIEIIARRVAREEAPKTIAGQVRDPNSSVSKSMHQNYVLERRR